MDEVMLDEVMLSACRSAGGTPDLCLKRPTAARVRGVIAGRGS
ncbi:hypothetical protein [Georgenia subflava]|nr:hypothetical protein [Georgenia subflava]